MTTLVKQANDLIYNLKMVASVDPEDRVSFRNGKAEITPKSVLGTLKRTIAGYVGVGESRKDTLDGLERLFDALEKLVRDYFCSVTLLEQRQRIISGVHHSDGKVSEYDIKACNDALLTLQRLKPEVENTISTDEKGLHALRVTYAGCKKTEIRIRCLMDRVPPIVNNIEELMDNVRQIKPALPS